MTHISSTEEIKMILEEYEVRLDAYKVKELEEKGYTVFPQLLSNTQLDSIRKKFEKLMYQQGYHDGRMIDNDESSIADIILMQFQSEHQHSSETINEVRNLVNESDVFDSLYTTPELIAGVYYFMKMDFKLSELTAREILPGGWVPQSVRPKKSDYELEQISLQALWLLDDYTEQNGGIAIAEGSHRFANQITLDDDGVNFDPVYAPAGSLILLDTRLSIMEPHNQSTYNKRMLFANYIVRNQTQALPQKDIIRMSTYNRISDLAKFILDV